MAAQRTAPGRRLTEQRKARARAAPPDADSSALSPTRRDPFGPDLGLLLVFAVLYSLWALRLCAILPRPAAGLPAVPHRCRHPPASARVEQQRRLEVVLVVVCGAGLAVTYLGDRARAGAADAPRASPSGIAADTSASIDRGAGTPPGAGGARAPGRFPCDRFAVRPGRAPHTSASRRRPPTTARRVAAHPGRRQPARAAPSGPDAQHFVLPGGRVAFLFETDSRRTRAARMARRRLEWIDPCDIEGLAMSLGRKACEHLVDGHRVECVVGWASAPADGLNADDLMYVAEAGAQSTAAFRRVAGGQVAVPERARVAAG